MTVEAELERVREAYPLVEELSEERLASLRATLLEAIDASRPPARSRRRRHVVAMGVVLAAAAAAAVVITRPATPNRPASVPARAILRGAAAGLAVPRGAVLHTAFTSVQTFKTGASSRSRAEAWQAFSPPYDARYVSRLPGRAARETAVSAGRLLLYDRARDTIYTHTPRSLTAPVQRPPDVRATALALVRSAHARVREHVRFAGRAATEVSGPGAIPGSRVSYYLAPRTHRPLGLVTRVTGETVTVRFTGYRRLPGTVADRRLVTLTGAHPSARIDASAAAYKAALARLFGP